MGKRSRLTTQEFIKLAWTGFLGLSGLGALLAIFRFLSYESAETVVSEIDIGDQSKYPPGSVSPLPEYHVVLFNREGVYSAISTTCTHLGCQVELQQGEFACPCHGSRFALDGVVRRGPAKLDLEKWQVLEDQDGHLILKQQSG